MSNKLPNILLIMTDQHRGDCLSIEDHPTVMTPNMDSIGGQGIRFSKAYTSCPLCMPARRSLLSGQYPSTHGLCGNKAGTEWDSAPITLPLALKENGYHTYIVGRDMHQYPERRRFGYDHMVTKQYDKWLTSKVPDIYLREKRSPGL